MRRFRTWLAFTTRRIRFWLADRLVATYDGAIVSRAVYKQGLEYLGDFAEDIQKSGAIRSRPRIFAALEQKTNVMTQTFVDALKLGDASATIAEAREAYIAARARALPRKKKRALIHQQALQAMARAGVSSRAGIEGDA